MTFLASQPFICIHWIMNLDRANDQHSSYIYYLELPLN